MYKIMMLMPGDPYPVFIRYIRLDEDADRTIEALKASANVAIYSLEKVNVGHPSWARRLSKGAKAKS